LDRQDAGIVAALGQQSALRKRGKGVISFSAGDKSPRAAHDPRKIGLFRMFRIRKISPALPGLSPK
jgi:hypothetical protein